MGSAMSLVTGVLVVTWPTGFTSNHLGAKLGRRLCKEDIQGGCPAKTRPTLPVLEQVQGTRIP